MADYIQDYLSKYLLQYSQSKEFIIDVFGNSTEANAVMVVDAITYFVHNSINNNK